MEKYIIVPEYRPLYAMAKCFGPTHGPLTKPCPTPIDVIESLLRQTGKEALTIYEVEPRENGKFSDPVQLTLSNFKLPYTKIAGKKSSALTDDVLNEIIDNTKKINAEVPDAAPVEPVVEAEEPVLNIDEAETVAGDGPFIDTASVADTVSVNASVPSANTHMTKAERRAARKAAEAKTASDDTTEE